VKAAIGKLHRFAASRAGFLLQIGISALLLMWLASALDARTWAAVRAIGIQGLLAATLVFSTSQVFAGLRLACLLGKPWPWPLAIISTSTGVFWSTFLPESIGGEVVRIARLRAARIELPRATGAIFFDRLLNSIGTGTLLVVSLAGLVATGTLKNPNAFLLSLALMTVAAGLAIWGARAIAKRSLPGFAKSFFAPIRQLVANPSLLLVAGVLTICNIGSSVLAQWLLANLIGMDVSFFTLTSIICLVAAAALLPISLNGIGVQEVSFVYLLTSAGVAADKAILYSLLVRAIIVGNSLIAALVIFLRRMLGSPLDVRVRVEGD
jgi:uncharacterized membrane protein YbhN (UPF0104 family)